MNVCKLGLSIAMLLSGGMAFAQGTVDDYNRAYALREKFSANKVFYSNVTPQWIEGTHQFWYVRNTPEGRIYVSVNADKKKQKGVVRPQASGKRTEQRIRQRSKARSNPTGTATSEPELRYASFCFWQSALDVRHPQKSVGK